MYGRNLTTSQIRPVLDHIFRQNEQSALTGERGTPVMIWGSHGLGKTQLVTEYAKSRGWKLAYCAPAQFEEMGDLHGLPTLVDPDKSIAGDEYTVYSPPEWAPRTDGPGILLLDDINRADDRILRGVMQLLQNFELMSWSLPPGWQIVCTANPDNADYSVTPMDDAMLTRMLHTTLVFDARSWAEWAVAADIDVRCVDFVLTYPETVNNKRSTPRSLTQFFRQIKNISDWSANLPLIEILAASALDTDTVSAFTAFLTSDLGRLVPPEEILDSGDFGKVSERIKQLSQGKKGATRVDRLAAMFTRLRLHLQKLDYAASPTAAPNLVALFELAFVPEDLKVGLFMELAKSASPQVRKLLDDKRLAELVLGAL